MKIYKVYLIFGKHGNDVLTVSFVVNTIYGDIEFKDQQIAKPTAA